MKTPTFEEISFRAYHLWESRGRPDGQEAAIECWLQAERSLWSDVAEYGGDDFEANEDREFEDQGEPAEGITTDTEISNLDRALPADERRRARDARRGGNGRAPSYPERPVQERVLVVVNRGRLRIYQTDSETPELVGGFDLPGGDQNYTDNDSDRAGRFPGSRGVSPGGSIDERLPMQEEQQRRSAKEAARHIWAYLRNHPQARWSFAAGPALHRLILDQLPVALHARLDQAIAKDLVNMPLPELLGHFEARHV